MRKNSNILNKISWATVGLYLVLVFIGWISVYAAVYNDEHRSIFDFSQRYGKQLIWIVTALLVAVAIMLVDSKFYSVFAYIIYGVAILLLALVLVAGTEINGSRSWFVFGPIRLQPAELAKVAASLALARLMSAHGFVLKRKSNLFLISLIVAVPVGIIFLQHDTGSALVFGSFLLMLYREGLSGWFVNIVLFAALVFILSFIWEPVSVLMLCAVTSLLVFVIRRRKLLPLLLAAACIFGPYFLIMNYLFQVEDANPRLDYIFLALSVVVLIWGVIYGIRRNLRYMKYIVLFFIGSVALAYSTDYVSDHFLKPHQRDRIDNLLGLKEDLQGTGYNVHQSKVAIGSGGFSGKGFLQGTQTKYNFVPEQSTDFIFCTIGEEWGFVGTFIVIVCYLLLLFRLVIISERQKDIFGRVYGYCVTSILFFHFAINIAMTIGLAPVIGIPLPFISYGGSSLWAFTILLFILLKIDAVRWD